jgi:PPOX class probable F420-dependent enzyme
MAQIEGPARELLEQPHHAVVSTLNENGSIHSTVAWIDVEDGTASLNSAVGRKWPSNIDRDPRVSITVYDQSNPYEYVEIRGTARTTLEGADEHIDRLAKKYMGADSYPFRTPEEQRVKIIVDAERIRHQKQG